MDGDIAAIIQAVGTIILGFFTYNQYTKNKETDLRIDRIKEQDFKNNKRRSDNSMLVFGALWELLYTLKASRVYIVQPHPLGDEEYLSVYFEVKRKGVEPMKPHIQEMKISDVAKFSEGLIKTPFALITNIDEQVEDRYARSILSSYGCKKALMKRLSDNKYDWVGTIFCEFTNDEEELDENECKSVLNNTANNIQYIIPEFNGNR